VKESFHRESSDWPQPGEKKPLLKGPSINSKVKQQENLGGLCGIGYGNQQA
jgi:hypothetical protein